MPRLLKAKLRTLLHEHKVESYKLSHDPETRKEIETRARGLVEEILGQPFKYRFHKDVDRERAEQLNLIHWYATEAMLPPVLGSLAERIALLEKRQEMHLGIIEKVLEAVSDEGGKAPA